MSERKSPKEQFKQFSNKFDYFGVQLSFNIRKQELYTSTFEEIFLLFLLYALLFLL